MTYYKIVRIKNGEPYTLFHGINGSRKIPVNSWILADKKIVRDGSKGSTEYISGWHLFSNLDECRAYLVNKFKVLDNKGIICCKAKGIRKKEHSPNNVLLADSIKITKIDNGRYNA